MRGSGKGWVTAEYSMLPGSSPERIDREAARGKQSGRTMEIQRLIGRSLRAVTDMRALGERQIIVDCDVLQADGGTRTASICGGYLALHDALSRRRAGAARSRAVRSPPTARRSASASSTARPVLDLPYVEDSTAEVDMNVVMTSDGPLRRGAGHRRGPRLQPRRAGRAARRWPRAGSPRSSPCRTSSSASRRPAAAGR